MSTTALGSRLVIGGTHSGVGKTTVATGLMAALRRAGHRPAGAKVGPDFIDPGYHSLATGRPPRNLDPWLCGPDAMAPLAARAADGADLLVIEGVMGLFDGAGDGTTSSTADLARLLDAPVVLVVDASAMSTSAAALVHGYRTWDPAVRVAGVILNRVGSPTHEALLREALADSDVEVVGALPRDDRLTWRDRHLGLVPVVESPEAVEASIEVLAELIAEHVDLQAVVGLASAAPSQRAGPINLPQRGAGCRIGVATGRAFSFTYTDTLDALRAAGAEVVAFDPMSDATLPEGLGGLIVGGGFPEVHVAELSRNRRMLDDIARLVGAGLPTWAECGGLMLLCGSLDGHAMAGVIDADAEMSGRLTLGYREVVTRRQSPVGAAGTAFRGHEFHYSSVIPAGDALALHSRWGDYLEGWASPSLLATYVHHHPGGDPSLIAAFASTCARHKRPAP